MIAVWVIKGKDTMLLIGPLEVVKDSVTEVLVLVAQDLRIKSADVAGHFPKNNPGGGGVPAPHGVSLLIALQKIIISTQSVLAGWIKREGISFGKVHPSSSKILDISSSHFSHNDSQPTAWIDDVSIDDRDILASRKVEAQVVAA